MGEVSESTQHFWVSGVQQRKNFKCWDTLNAEILLLSISIYSTSTSFYITVCKIVCNTQPTIKHCQQVATFSNVACVCVCVNFRPECVCYCILGLREGGGGYFEGLDQSVCDTCSQRLREGGVCVLFLRFRPEFYVLLAARDWGKDDCVLFWRFRLECVCYCKPGTEGRMTVFYFEGLDWSMCVTAARDWEKDDCVLFWRFRLKCVCYCSQGLRKGWLCFILKVETGACVLLQPGTEGRMTVFYFEGLDWSVCYCSQELREGGMCFILKV